MATLTDLPLKYRAFMRLYRYRHVDWRAGSRLSKPLSAARVATITSAGYYLRGQAPFDASVRGGDCSYRVIAAHANIDTLHIGNRSDAFDPTGIELDKNLAFPVDRLHELAWERKIGSAAARHFSIMGSITAPGRLVS
jgi:D-proline reductase (dithiol) PrdB